MDSKQEAALLAAAILLIFPIQVRAQFSISVPILLISPDARAGGMGETATGLADDGSAIFWNVGGLGLFNGDHVTFTNAARLPEFGPYLYNGFNPNLNYYFLSYSHYVADWKSSFAASVAYLDVNPLYYSQNIPDIIKSWSAHNMAIALGYGREISDGLGFGAGLRLIKSYLGQYGAEEGQGSATNTDFSLDLGLLYRPQELALPFIGNFDNRLGLGITLTNFGPNLYYKEQAAHEPLPANLRFGLSIHLVKSQFNNLYINLDMNKSMVSLRFTGGDTVIDMYGDTVLTPWLRTFDSPPKSFVTTWSSGNVLKEIVLNFGIEYWYGQPRLVAIRCGYFKESYSLGGRNFYTLGAGIRHGIFGFDLAYISSVEANSAFVNQLRFSLALNWGGESNF
jgi:Type IX secretion system protein PorV